MPPASLQPDRLIAEGEISASSINSPSASGMALGHAVGLYMISLITTGPTAAPRFTDPSEGELCITNSAFWLVWKYPREVPETPGIEAPYFICARWPVRLPPASAAETKNSPPHPFNTNEPLNVLSGITRYAPGAIVKPPPSRNFLRFARSS